MEAARRPASAEAATDANAPGHQGSHIEEGLLIIGSALRLAVKNRLIVDALLHRRDYDHDRQLASLEADIRELIAEKETDAARLRIAWERASRRRGRPSSPDDYRRADVPALQEREDDTRALAEALGSLLAESDFLDRTLDAARSSALDEILEARVLPPERFLEQLDADELEKRRNGVKDDLESLRRVRIARGELAP